MAITTTYVRLDIYTGQIQQTQSSHIFDRTKKHYTAFMVELHHRMAQGSQIVVVNLVLTDMRSGSQEEHEKWKQRMILLSFTTNNVPLHAENLMEITLFSLEYQYFPSLLDLCLQQNGLKCKTRCSFVKVLELALLNYKVKHPKTKNNQKETVDRCHRRALPPGLEWRYRDPASVSL